MAQLTRPTSSCCAAGQADEARVDTTESGGCTHRFLLAMVAYETTGSDEIDSSAQTAAPCCVGFARFGP